jgi:hypothetical protein
MNNYVIVDDLFSKIEQRTLELFVLHKTELSWKYSPYSTYSDTNVINQFRENDSDIFTTAGGSFSHMIYYSDGNGQELKSDYYDQFARLPSAIANKFNVEINKLYRMNIMLTMPDSTNSLKYGLPHVDRTEKENGKTIVYYVNDADGDTILFNEMYDTEFDFSKKTVAARVSPKKGRAVMFDTLRYHAASRSTKLPRAIININFS